jgi:hypothetical protein
MNEDPRARRPARNEENSPTGNRQTFLFLIQTEKYGAVAFDAAVFILLTRLYSPVFLPSQVVSGSRGMVS